MPKIRTNAENWITSSVKDWDILSLKRLFFLREGGAWGEESGSNGNDVVCVRIADFDYPNMTIKKNIEYTKRNYTKSIIKKLQLRNGDILIEKSGGGENTPVGRTVLFDLEIPALFANFMDRLRVRDHYNFSFIQFVLYYMYKTGLSSQYIKQTTGIQNLDLTEFLEAQKVAVPEISKQTAIANYLSEKCSEVENIIADQKVMIKKLSKYKHSLITEAVCRGLAHDVSMKDSGVDWIGRTPKHWDIKRLKYVFKIRKDIAGREGFDILSVTQRGIKIKDISSNEGQIAQNYSKYQLVDKNDFVMNHMDLLTGFVDCSKYDGVTSPDYRVFKLIEDNSNRQYYNYVFQQCYKNKIFYGLGQGVSNFGRWRLPRGMFLNFMIPEPPLQEQEEIANYLDSKCKQIETAIAKKEKIINKLEEFKKSLIYECVTGKKEIS